MQAFFGWKRTQFDRDYGMTMAEYLHNFYVSNIYTYTAPDDTLLSIVLTCEQGAHVYLENLAYNMAYEKFSPGIILYTKVLEKLIEKQKAALFLGGGQQEYKKRYGAVETQCYSQTVYRSRVLFLRARLAQKKASAMHRAKSGVKNLLKSLLKKRVVQ